ncbi:PIG-L family deacetylase [Propionibacteriaceae bacterium G1746]|uniref:PIG-L family deacetylase n=1 Tax=Aestuariimicrobium sp. G57 TaxID=3418485 RepID=UPI003C1CC53E
MLLSGAHRVLFIHAHPDDETLATGAMIANLVADGVEVDLVTCTRGERGEVVPGVLPADISAEALAFHRDEELRAAYGHLGVRVHAYLGTPPASRDGAQREYEDSGMQWLRPGMAGPAEDVSDKAFSLQSFDELVDDLLAFIAAHEPEVLLSYDSAGSYGHPDHVRAHDITKAAAARAGLPFLEFIPWHDDRDINATGVDWADYTEQLPAVLAAHDSHRTQFTRDGDDITHVGGQRQKLVTRVGLRRIAAEGA